MVDLETRGTVPGCVGFSIGAVEFLPLEGRTGSEFYTVISIEDSLACFLREDADTVEWWDKQSEEARQALTAAMQPDAPKLAAALEDFNRWQAALGLKSKIRTWGNGADFDNPILRCMYDCAGVSPYAGSYGGRCYRTMKNLDELLGASFAFRKLQRTGTHHHALDDAKSQAMHLMEELAVIRARFDLAGRSDF
jgi:hypothetical protein